MRILLVKTSSLGDVVHNLPVVSDIHQALPDAQIDWLVEEAFADIPRLHPAVGRVVPVALRRWRRALAAPATWREFRTFRADLRVERYDRVIDTQGLIKSAVLAALADGRRCGHAASGARESLAAWFYRDRHVVARGLHAVERNRRLAAACLGYAVDTGADYGLRAAPLSAPWLPTGRPYAVLLTATSRADKLWPEEDWTRIGRWLVESGRSVVLPAGSAAERERAARIAAHIPDSVPAPPLGIAELAGLMAGADRIVGLDTGLSHLAAALGRPTLALFCGSDAALTGLHAGPSARNLGNIGQPPTAGMVIDALRAWAP